MLSCLTEPVSPNLAADYHRLIALAGYVAQDTPRTVGAFRAALRLQPGYQLPEAIAPKGNALADQLQTAKLAGPAKVEALAPIDDGVILVDGTASVVRSKETPVLLQLIGGDGTLVDSVYLDSGTPLPTWITTVASPMAQATALTRPGPQPHLLWTSVGLAATSAGIYTWAGTQRALYDESSTDFQDLDALRSRTNNLVLVSGATATSAAIACTMAFLVGGS
jgi:hypothetical protein